MLQTRLILVSLVAPLAFIAGCGGAKDSQPSASSAAAAKNPNTDEHGHLPSAHGGILIPIGADNYHAEAVFEKGGVLRLYMLGRDESKVIEVESQKLTAFLKADGDVEATSIPIWADPQSDDTAGKTSQFIAKVPAEYQGKKLSVTVPKIVIASERYRLAFASAVAESHEEVMPEKVANDAEKALYLTPGGKYSQADILANGNVTASQKFAGFKATHDLKPKAGDKICPVTLTKANQKCAWIVGGKTYEFCCPPCVDEFVQLAKNKPDEVKEPGEYIKR